MQSRSHLDWIGVAVLAVCLVTVAACGNTIAPPTNASGEADVAGCVAYQARPEGRLVYRVPQLSVGDPRRCSIAAMALAVHNNGEFRNFYGSRPIDAPPQAIEPVMRRLRLEASTLSITALIASLVIPQL